MSEVDHPKHYTHGTIECIQAIEAACASWDPEIAPHLANVLKYIWRYKYKAGLTDLQKAHWYMTRALEIMEESGE